MINQKKVFILVLALCSFFSFHRGYAASLDATDEATAISTTDLGQKIKACCSECVLIDGLILNNTLAKDAIATQVTEITATHKSSMDYIFNFINTKIKQYAFGQAYQNHTDEVISCINQCCEAIDLSFKCSSLYEITKEDFIDFCCQNLVGLMVDSNNGNVKVYPRELMPIINIAQKMNINLLQPCKHGITLFAYNWRHMMPSVMEKKGEYCFNGGHLLKATSGDWKIYKEAGEKINPVVFTMTNKMEMIELSVAGQDIPLRYQTERHIHDSGNINAKDIKKKSTSFFSDDYFNYQKNMKNSFKDVANWMESRYLDYQNSTNEAPEDEDTAGYLSDTYDKTASFVLAKKKNTSNDKKSFLIRIIFDEKGYKHDLVWEDTLAQPRAIIKSIYPMTEKSGRKNGFCEQARGYSKRKRKINFK